jgi:hypothetical protein
MEPGVLEMERIEREAWRDLAGAAAPAFAQAIGLEHKPMGGVLFMMASRIPAFQFNWLAGAGLESDDSDAVGRAVARFRESGQTKFIVQVPPSPRAGAIAARAKAEGLAEHPLAWAKFVRPTRDPPSSAGTAIREVGPDEAALFADTAIAGFGMPPPMGQWIERIVGRKGWRCFVAFADGAPVGAGALFLRDGLAWVGIGATRAEARRRGAHRALLARRIEAAREDGARFAVTETGVPQPGQDAPSYRNILASGFRVAYVRPNWAPPG